jgi:hypothetical protein
MKLSKNEVADIIENFLSKTDQTWDWDDFISIRLSDPEVDKVRQHCARIREDFPPDEPGEYTNEAGRAVLRKLASELRVSGAA